jgi:mono/diheme cytochrome c family protein
MSTNQMKLPAGRVVRTAAVIVVVLTACSHSVLPLPSLSAAPSRDSAQLVARGEYIVRNVAACGGCHAADQADPDGPLTGGAEFKGWRLGTIRASDITSDSLRGIGTWTDAQIARAIRNGQNKDGHLIAPVMPYHWLNGMSDDDALAVARYLKSTLPEYNAVRQDPNLIYKIGRALFLRPVSGEARTAPPRGPTAAYGEYLALHVGLCADCHTPRGGLMSSPDMRRLFAGDAHPPKDFPANPANLTPDSATGIGRWSEANFIQTMRTGVNPAGDSLHPFMPWRQQGRMTDDDLRAIYRYLRTVPAIRNEVPRRGK